MENKKISIASDHAGVSLKDLVSEHLSREGHEIINHGTFNNDSVDYPDYAKKVTNDIISQVSDFGILICGTGQGMAITANKQVGIRAALCYEPEIAELSRSHNDCNVLTLGARFIDSMVAIECILKFINTPFEGGRHKDRIDKI